MCVWVGWHSMILGKVSNTWSTSRQSLFVAWPYSQGCEPTPNTFPVKKPSDVQTHAGMSGWPLAWIAQKKMAANSCGKLDFPFHHAPSRILPKLPGLLRDESRRKNKERRAGAQTNTNNYKEPITAWPSPGVPNVNLAQEGAFDGDPDLHRAAKRPRPSLRPHTAPEVVRARESASKKPPAKPFGELLIEDFSLGKAAASKVFRPTLKYFLVLFNMLGWVSTKIKYPIPFAISTQIITIIGTNFNLKFQKPCVI